jgi:hypothetical protein
MLRAALERRRQRQRLPGIAAQGNGLDQFHAPHGQACRSCRRRSDRRAPAPRWHGRALPARRGRPAPRSPRSAPPASPATGRRDNSPPARQRKSTARATGRSTTRPSAVATASTSRAMMKRPATRSAISTRRGFSAAARSIRRWIAATRVASPTRSTRITSGLAVFTLPPIRHRRPAWHRAALAGQQGFIRRAFAIEHEAVGRHRLARLDLHRVAGAQFGHGATARLPRSCRPARPPAGWRTPEWPAPASRRCAPPSAAPSFPGSAR